MQNARHEALQTTCGAALFHALHFVMNLHTDPACQPLIQATPPSQQNQPQATSSRLRRIASQQLVVDPFIAPAVVNSSKFFARVLEKASLNQLLDTIKDGAPKLQQSVMNIVLLLFSAPLGAALAVKINGSLEEGDHAISVDGHGSGQGANGALKLDLQHAPAVLAALQPHRMFFLRAHHVVVPTLLRLVEQGSSTAIRAKALLLLQLTLAHMPLLLTNYRSASCQ